MLYDRLLVPPTGHREPSSVAVYLPHGRQQQPADNDDRKEHSGGLRIQSPASIHSNGTYYWVCPSTVKVSILELNAVLFRIVGNLRKDSSLRPWWLETTIHDAGNALWIAGKDRGGTCQCPYDYATTERGLGRGEILAYFPAHSTNWEKFAKSLRAARLLTRIQFPFSF